MLCVSRESGKVPCVSREPHFGPEHAQHAALQKNDMLSRDEIAGIIQECVAHELRPLQKELLNLREDIAIRPLQKEISAMREDIAIRPLQKEISALREDVASINEASGQGSKKVLQAIMEMHKVYEQDHLQDAQGIKGLHAEVEQLAKLMSEPKMRVEAAEKKVFAAEPLASSDLDHTCVDVDIHEPRVRPISVAKYHMVQQEANCGCDKSSERQTALVKALGHEDLELEKDGRFVDADHLATVLKASLREVLPDSMMQADVNGQAKGKASPAKPAEQPADVEANMNTAIDTRKSRQPITKDEFDDDIVKQQIYEIVDQQLNEKNAFEVAADLGGLGGWIARSRPPGLLAYSTETRWFAALESCMIIGHTLLVAYETNNKIKAALMEPPGQVDSDWFDKANVVFSVAFAVELAYRIAVLRTWFFVSPDYGWNCFDFFIVVSSLIAEKMSGPNLKFVRTLRCFRLVRILSVVRYFRELRRILDAILACMGTMLWSFVFLGLMTFMCSLLMLQGVIDAVDDLELGSEERSTVVKGAQVWWSSLPGTMINLAAVVAGAGDWLEMKEPLDDAGFMYAYFFILYKCFLLIGVLQVLTGVFLESTQENKNQEMVVQGEQIREEMFARQMLAVFKQMDENGEGEIREKRFRTAVRLPEIKAVLSSYHILPKHTHELFDLLDESKNGVLTAAEFVSGMMDLKGEANAMDVRLVLKAIFDSKFKDESLWSTN